MSDEVLKHVDEFPEELKSVREEDVSLLTAYNCKLFAFLLYGPCTGSTCIALQALVSL